jgi:catechol 2,3-dioxygenase
LEDCVECIDPATAIGAVHLTISDLDGSIQFYTDRLGFTVHRRQERIASLGAEGPDLLVLSQCESAPKVRRTTGLYHFAILVPSRVDLARSLRRLAETDTLMQGFADHAVSESLYLADPDGNGIEVYRDRPRAEWPRVGGQVQMVADPLDLDTLLSELDDVGYTWTGLARETTIGHVHLHVSRLSDAEVFYSRVLGFAVTLRYGDGALFLAAGGYHHHIGLNTWAGVGATPPPPGAIGLRHFVVRLPNEAALARVMTRVRSSGLVVEDVEGAFLVRDPSKNGILLVADRG